MYAVTVFWNPDPAIIARLNTPTLPDRRTRNPSMSHVNRSILCRLVITLLPVVTNAQVQPVELPRVVVRSELLTDSAATVSVIRLEEQTLADETLPAASTKIANFFVAANGAHSFNDVFSLRGLSNTPIFGDPAVSVYLNDLPLGSGFTFPDSLTWFERLEIYRGPTQNTVYGQAGSAGVLVMGTLEPRATPRGELRAAAGSFARRSVTAAVSSAKGLLEAYVIANGSTRDGYVTNSTLGHDIDFQNNRAGLIQLRVSPGTGSEITLLATRMRARDGSQPLVPLGGPFFAVSRSAEGFTSLDTWNAALTAARTIPAGRLRTTISHSDWDLGPYRSVLAFGPGAELGNDVQLRQRVWNGEIKLTGGTVSPIHWSTGLFYSKGETDGAFSRAFGPFLFERSSYRIVATKLAGLGEATWPFGQRLNLTAGLRLEDSIKQMRRIELVPTAQDFNGQVESTAWLPKLGLNYLMTEHQTLYAIVGAGFKPGGFSAFTGNPSLAAFGPERTNTIEAGLTFRRPERALSATARLYFYYIKGYQIERSFATSAVADDYLVVNAPHATSWGAELELSWKPFATLSVTTALGMSDVTLRKFVDPYTTASFSGNRAPAVPLYDACLQVAWASKSGIFVQTEMSANGRTYYTEGEDISFGQRAYALLRAKAGYANQDWALTLYGDNLANTKYYSAITPGAGHATPGEPRTFGVEVSRKF